MLKPLLIAILLIISASVFGQQSLIGSWEHSNNQAKIIINLRDDNTYNQKWYEDGKVNNTYTGQWKISGSDLQLFPNYPENTMVKIKFYSIGENQLNFYKTKFANGDMYRNDDFGIKEIYYKIETEEEKQAKEKEEANRIEQEKIMAEKLSQYIESGKDFYSQGNYEQAIYEFKLANELDENKSDEYREQFESSYVNLANQNYINKNYLKAREYYMNANSFSTNGKYAPNIEESNYKISQQLELEGDNFFKVYEYEKAIKKYEESLAYSKIDSKEIKKKIALCYEKKGDDLFRNDRYEAAISFYSLSLSNYNSIQVSNKIVKAKNEIAYNEELKYKWELQAIGGYSMNKSDANFDKLFDNVFYAGLRGNYRVNKYLFVGLEGSGSEFESTKKRDILNSVGIDTTGLIFDNTYSSSVKFNMNTIGLNIGGGYFIGMFNPYAILQVSTNRISTIEVDYLKEVPNTGGAYGRNMYSMQESYSLGYGIGGGIRIGNEKYKFDVGVSKNYIDGKDLFKGFNSLKITIGAMIVFK